MARTQGIEQTRHGPRASPDWQPVPREAALDDVVVQVYRDDEIASPGARYANRHRVDTAAVDQDLSLTLPATCAPQIFDQADAGVSVIECLRPAG